MRSRNPKRTNQESQNEPARRTDNTQQESKTPQEECPTESCDGNVIVDSKTQERYCNGCGVVVEEDTIDHGPEWRSFNQQEREDRERTGNPMKNTLHDKGLSTTISDGSRDINGNNLSADKRAQMSRLRKWHNRSLTKDAKERSIKKGLVEINRMSSALGVCDSVPETAAMIFKQCSKNELLEGRSIEGMASAAVYAAARLEKVAQTYGEITHVSRVGENEIKRAYMYIRRELDIVVPPTPPTEYVPRFCSKLNIHSGGEQVAKSIIKQSKQTNMGNGAAPSSLAAAAVYAAGIITEQSVPQKEIKQKLDVCSVTIRDFYQDMLEVYDGFDLNEVPHNGKLTADDIKEHVRGSDDV